MGSSTDVKIDLELEDENGTMVEVVSFANVSFDDFDEFTRYVTSFLWHRVRELRKSGGLKFHLPSNSDSEGITS